MHLCKPPVPAASFAEMLAEDQAERTRREFFAGDPCDADGFL